MSRVETPQVQRLGTQRVPPFSLSRADQRWLWPLLLLVGSLWLLQRQLHAHWLDLAWTARDLTDVQWSPDATHARLWLDAAGLPLAALAASLCLQVGRPGWRLPLAAAFAGSGVIGSDLVPGLSVWTPVPLLVLVGALGHALLSGTPERVSSTSRLLLWGQGAALFCGALWWAERLPDLTQAPPLLGSASLGLLWSGLAAPGLRDLGPLVFSLCAATVLLGQTPGTLRGGVARVLVFAGLSLGTALVFTLVVGGAAALLNVRSSFYPSVAAAALVAAGLDPARVLLSRSVRQLLYGERDDPSAVMQRVARRLEGGSGTGPRPGSRPETPTGLQLGVPSGRETIEAGAREAALALRLPSLHLELLRGDRLGYSELTTTAQSHEQVVGTLVAGGERLGVLTAAPRSAREAFTPGELRLLEGLSRQFAGAVHAWQLAEDLQTSQIGAVRAGEEERRRLRRDLHDGLGPSLSGLGLKIEAASVALVHSPRQAADTLDSLKRDVRECVAEVRRLVHDLRPPKLDDLGLIGALEDLLRGAEQAGLDAGLEVQEPLPPLGAAVEVAVYRIAQEAVTNVLRHAHASRVVLRLQHDRHTLTLECLDNGVGLPEVREPGVGSRSMRERAGALSGQLELTSRTASGVFAADRAAPTPSPTSVPGEADQGGTRVCARLPLGSPGVLGGSGE